MFSRVIGTSTSVGTDRRKASMNLVVGKTYI